MSNLFSRLSASTPFWRDHPPEGTRVEYLLIVSFAVMVGFVLGVLTATILGVSEKEEAVRREPLRAQEASRFRR
jgi:hypothetical protein